MSEARRVGDGPIGLGSAFELVARFAGRNVKLRYAIVEYEEPVRVVLEARQPGYVSRDAITVGPAPDGSTVHYDARLCFSGVARLIDPVMQLLFNRIGSRATAGLQAELNR